MATVTRPTAGYTPTNPITNTTKYQDDSAATSPKVAISSVKVDGDINKAFDVLTEHDSRIEAVELIATDGDKGDITVAGAVWTIDANVVSTGKIADDAVTFAKVQNIATTRILGRTTASSGNVEELTVGAGLTLAAGSLTPVTATDAAAGIVELATAAEVATGTDTARVAPVALMPVTLVASGVASNSVAVEFTGLTAAYSSYEFHIQDFVPITDNAEFIVQYYTAGAWVTGSYLYSGSYLVAPDTALTGYGSASDSRILVSAPTGGSGLATSNVGSEGGVGGVVTVFNPSSSARTVMTGQVGYSTATNARAAFTNVSGTNAATTAVTGVRFLFHSGNVASGSVKCFGRR